MADELDTTEEIDTETWDLSDLLEDDPAVEDAEDEADKVEQLEKKLSKVVSHVKNKEDKERVQKAIDEFLAGANEDEKDLAAVFLVGVDSVTQATKAIDSIKARAAKLAKPESEDETEEEDDEDVAAAFQTPAQGAPIKPKSEDEKLVERNKRGDKTALAELFFKSAPSPFKK